MNQTFNATPVMASSLTVNVLLNMLGSGLMTVKRLGAPFSENHYMLNDLVVNQRPSKLGQFIVLTSEDAEILQQPLEEGNSRLLLLGAESGNLVMAFDLPEEEIQQKLAPMMGNGFPLMRPFTPPQAMTNMAPPIQPWNNPAGLNPMPLQGRNDGFMHLSSEDPETLKGIIEAMTILGNNLDFPEITPSGQIIVNKDLVGTVNISGNIFDTMMHLFSQFRTAQSYAKDNIGLFNKAIGQLVALYVLKISNVKGTFSLSKPPKNPNPGEVLRLNGLSIVMNYTGRVVEYSVNR